MEPRVHRRRDVGGLVFGGILLAVGIYYLLQRTLGLDIPDLDWDQIWPIAVIVLGISVVAKAVQSRGSTDRP